MQRSVRMLNCCARPRIGWEVWGLLTRLVTRGVTPVKLRPRRAVGPTAVWGRRRLLDDLEKYASLGCERCTDIWMNELSLRWRARSASGHGGCRFCLTSSALFVVCPRPSFC